MASVRPIATTQEGLLKLVMEHVGTITGELTGEAAGWLLLLNTRNRELKQVDVKRFTAILEHGRWKNTGEPIIISCDGIINDGQHRLTAIYETGIPVVVDVRFGVEADAHHYTGTGRRRTGGDVLHMAGIADATAVAAISKIVWHYDHESIGSMNTPVEPAELQLWVQRYPVIQEAAKLARSLRLGLLQRSWFGAVIALVARRSSLDDAREFATAVDHGQGEEDSPTRRLHERLVQEAVNRAKTPTLDRLILGLKAWNAWIVQRPIHLLRVLDTERSFAGFPQILAPGESAKRGNRVGARRSANGGEG